MPDHPRGYTKRKVGYQPTDVGVALKYRERQKEEEVAFDEALQREMVECVREGCGKIECRLHACQTESSHVHVLVSWKHGRDWMSVRSSLKTALTKKLKEVEGRAVLSRGGSRKWVKSREHFDYLMTTYLPDHSGVGWYERTGWRQAR
jgi:REP element-mobilizing transposase RayT